mmetsp:Transcript_19294/g.61388  ORF Transcript_19294/g.61388 Transcript_19294/m.61388 type:complete len:406 (-) Transcript_19294:222-1439(-)
MRSKGKGECRESERRTAGHSRRSKRRPLRMPMVDTETRSMGIACRKPTPSCSACSVETRLGLSSGSPMPWKHTRSTRPACAATLGRFVATATAPASPSGAVCSGTSTSSPSSRCSVARTNRSEGIEPSRSSCGASLLRAVAASASAGGRMKNSTWASISSAVRFRTRPSRPPSQKEQRCLQPTWEDTHTTDSPLGYTMRVASQARPSCSRKYTLVQRTRPASPAPPRPNMAATSAGAGVLCKRSARAVSRALRRAARRRWASLRWASSVSISLRLAMGFSSAPPTSPSVGATVAPDACELGRRARDVRPRRPVEAVTAAASTRSVFRSEAPGCSRDSSGWSSGVATRTGWGNLLRMLSTPSEGMVGRTADEACARAWRLWSALQTPRSRLTAAGCPQRPQILRTC